MKSILAFAAISLSLPAWAQYDVDFKLCRDNAQIITDHPAKVIQALDEATQKCMSDKGYGLPPAQQKQIVLYKSVQALCNQTADEKVKADDLPAAGRNQVYLNCLNGHGYLQ